MAALRPGKFLLAAGIAIILAVGFFLFWRLRGQNNAGDVTIESAEPQAETVNVGGKEVVVDPLAGQQKVLVEELNPTAPPPQATDTPVPEEESVETASENTAQPTDTPQPEVRVTADPSSCGTGRSHRVAAGENVFRIAQAYNVAEQDIRNINGLSVYYTIYPDQILCLPGSASESATQDTQGRPNENNNTYNGCAAGFHAHTVVAGTTLFGLALDHNTTTAAIQANNNLGSETIYPGDVLCLPN